MYMYMYMYVYVYIYIYRRGPAFQACQVEILTGATGWTPSLRPRQDDGSQPGGAGAGWAGAPLKAARSPSGPSGLAAEGDEAAIFSVRFTI